MASLSSSSATMRWGMVYDEGSILSPTAYLAVAEGRFGEVLCYARAKPDCVEDRATLVFSGSIHPFPEWHAVVESGADRGASPFRGLVHGLILPDDSIVEGAEQVKKVTIKLYLPRDLSPLKDRGARGMVQEPWLRWLTLIPAIACLCREIFPHMQPENSSFTVYVGKVRYCADKYLPPVEDKDLGVFRLYSK